jgi:antitoxin ParD1/3/4
LPPHSPATHNAKKRPSETILANIASAAILDPMPTRNVNLTEHLDRFVETRVSSGRFSNASEVVREGLRLLEQREQEDQAKLEWLRGAVREGIEAIEQGDYTTLNSEREIDNLLRDIRRG